MMEKIKGEEIRGELLKRFGKETGEVFVSKLEPLGEEDELLGHGASWAAGSTRKISRQIRKLGRDSVRVAKVSDGEWACWVIVSNA